MVDRFLKSTDSGVSILRLRHSYLARIGCRMTHLNRAGNCLLHMGSEMQMQHPLRSDQGSHLCSPADHSSVGMFLVDRGTARMAGGRLCSVLARSVRMCHPSRNVPTGIRQGTGPGCSRCRRRHCPSRSSGRAFQFPDRRRLGRRYPRPPRVQGPLLRGTPSSILIRLSPLHRCESNLPKSLLRLVL